MSADILFILDYIILTRSRGFVIRARKVYLNRFKKKKIQFLTI